MITSPLKWHVDPRRPITYGIVQAGPDTPGGVPYVRPVDMNGHHGIVDPTALHNTTNEIASAYQRSSLRAGDVVVSIGPSYGKTMMVPVELSGANLTQGTARVAPASDVEPRYLVWALQSSLATRFWDAAVAGATFRALNLEPLAQTPIPTWERSEQRAIADFLDGETARIDVLIDSERHRAALALERLRSAAETLVLGQAELASRKNDALGPLHPIPQGWTSRRNKTFMRQVTDLSVDGLEELLSVSHITGVTPRSEKDVTMFLAESNAGYKKVQPGDLVVNTMWAWMGALGVSRCDGIVSPAYAVYRFTSPEVEPAYFHALFRSAAYVVEMTRHSTGVWTSRLRLYPHSFLAIRSPFPPGSRQREIAARIRDLDLDTERLNMLLVRSLRALHERRQAVITAAVTGDLDLPGLEI